jgi:hypothetical protein
VIANFGAMEQVVEISSVCCPLLIHGYPPVRPCILKYLKFNTVFVASCLRCSSPIRKNRLVGSGIFGPPDSGP